MGNQKSSDDLEGKKETAGTTLDTGETPQLSLPTETTKMTAQPNRRIVKAAHPKKDPSNTNKPTAVKTSSKDEDDEDDDDFEKVTSPLTASHVFESPSVARENEQEKASHQMQQRFTQAESRRHSKREKDLQHRRQRSLNDPNAAAAANTPTNQASSSFLANPMSRFLSVFSVDASHPKRAHSSASLTSEEEGDGGEDDGTAQEPLEKRPRTDDAAAEADAGAGGGGAAAKKDDTAPPASNNYFTITTTKTVILVAAAAVVVGLVIRWSRSQKI